MDSVALDTANLDLADLVSRVERGEHIVLTREGTPVADLVPRPQGRKGGIDFAAGEAFLAEHGIAHHAGFVAPDFDDPLPEDFLIRPLPER